MNASSSTMFKRVRLTATVTLSLLILLLSTAGIQPVAAVENAALDVSFVAGDLPILAASDMEPQIVAASNFVQGPTFSGVQEPSQPIAAQGGPSPEVVMREHFQSVPQHNTNVAMLVGSGSISGTVFEDDGTTPLQGVEVCVNDHPTNAFMGCDTTDVSGDYSVGSLDTGTYRVRAEITGWAFEFYDDAGGNGEFATPVPVTDPSDTPNIDFVLETGGTISGTVYQDDGVTPIPNLEVGAGSLWIATCTDGSGNYTLQSLPLDTPITVSARSEAGCIGSGGPYALEWWEEVENYEDATEITLTSGAPNYPDVDFTLAPGGSISGTVYEADGTTPIPFAEICVDVPNVDWNNVCGEADASGDYTIIGLPANSYRVRAWASGRALELYQELGGDSSNITTPVVVTPPNDTPNIDFTLDPGGTISGTVYETDGTTPIPFINVDVFGWWQGACTDANGNYVIENLPLNTSLTVAASLWDNHCGGSNNYIAEWWNNVPDQGSATAITLTGGSPNAPGTNFTLAVGGSISGTVYEIDGTTAIEGAEVCATDTGTNFHIGCAQTNASGDYTLGGVPSGTFWVRADAPGKAVEFYMETPGSGEDADEVSVTPPNDTPGIDFTLDPGGTITGTVYEDDGTTPIPNIPVQPGPFWLGQCTDASGNFTIEHIPLGIPFTVRAAKDTFCGTGGPTYAGEWWQESPSENGATWITLTGGTPTQNAVNFTLDPGGYITGTVYEDDGATSMSSIPVDIGNGGWGTCTDGSGNYSIGPFAIGTVVTVNAGGGPRWGGCGYNNTIMEWWQEAADQGSATAITVNAPLVTGKDFTLDVGGTISGTVYESDGTTPIPNAEVCAEDFYTNNWIGCINADGSGNYTLPALYTGSYRVRAQVVGYALEFYNGVIGDGSGATPVPVVAPNDTGGINFTLDQGGSISGTVYEADGTTPIPNINVQVDGVWHGVCTDGLGNYTLDYMPLGTPLSVSAARPTNWCNGASGNYALEYWQEKPDYGSANGITLTGGTPDVIDIDFTLDPAGSISGTVYETDGTTAVSGADVCVHTYADNEWVNCVQSDGSGNYTVTGLITGSYRVHVTKSGYAVEYYNEAGPSGDAANSVSVTAPNDTPDIDFTLDPGGTISGTVYEVDGTTPIPNMTVEVDNIWLGTCTDGSGNYTLDFLPLDTPITIAASRGFNWCGGASGLVAEWWQESPNQGGALPITLTSGTPDVTGKDFTLEVGGSISGTVIEVDGVTAIPNADVCLNDFATGAGLGCTQTDTNGDYSFLGLGTGNYRVSANTSNRVIEYYNEAGPLSSDADPVAVTAPSNTSNINFTLDPGGTISGTVYESDGTTPVVDIKVRLLSVDPGFATYVCTDASGNYTIPAVAKDIDLLIVATSFDAWGDCTQGTLAIEYWEETGDPGSATYIQVTDATPNLIDIDFTLDDGGSVSGTVIDQNTSNPLAGMVVLAGPVGSGSSFHGEFTCTDGSGNYTIDGLPIDVPMEVAAISAPWFCGGPSNYITEYWEETYLQNATYITLTSGTPDVGNIDFTLQQGGSISGTVTDELDNPLANISVGIDTISWTNVCTDASGNYTFNDVPWGEPVKVWAGDWGSCGPIDYVREWWEEVPDIASATTITLSSGTPNQTGIDFTLEEGGSISGTVTDALTTDPLEGIWVAVPLPNAGFLMDTCTAADGSYTLTGLPKDTPVVIQASSHFWCPGSQLYGTEYWQEVPDQGSATGITLTAGTPDVTGIDFTLVYETIPPTDPTSISSSSHTVGQSSEDNTIDVMWSNDASDDESGVAGYSTLWDNSPSTTPDDSIEHNAATLTETSPALGPGTWYFHLSTCDNAGNCTNTLHLGPFYILSILGPGYYEETELGLVFDVDWSSTAHASYSGGAAMQSTANAAELNATFNGNALTLYRLMSPASGAMEVCIDAQPCQPVSNVSATTRYQEPVGFYDLGAGPHTLIVRAISGSPVTLDSVQIHDLMPMAPGYYESDDPALSYSPGWTTSSDAQSSSGSIEYTISPTGTVQFAFNGNGLVLYRVTNKLRGAMEVCIDGDCQVISNYTLWVRRQQPVGFYGLTPGDHTVVIRNTSTAITDIDAMEVLDLVQLPPGYFEQDDPLLNYTGDWPTVVNASASGGSLVTNEQPLGHMQFMFTGNAFTLYRLTNSARGTVQVCIDDLPCELVNNYTPATRWQQPVSFFGLGLGDHLVVVRNVGGTTMDIDAVEVHDLPVLGAGSYEQDDAALVYLGNWSTVANGSASGGSIAFNSDEQASLSFLFDGNAFTLYRLTNSVRGAMEVCIDALPCTLVSNYSPTANWQTPVTFSGLADGIHLVQVRNTAATAMDIDSVEIVSLATLASGSYEETEPDLHYTGTWLVNNHAGHSGGSILYSTQPTATVMFQYTGSTLTLHRMLNSARSLIEICVDDMPCTVVNNYSASTLRNQTVAIGGIPSGTHVVIIRNASNAVMDIDALDFAP